MELCSIFFSYLRLLLFLNPLRWISQGLRLIVNYYNKVTYVIESVQFLKFETLVRRWVGLKNMKNAIFGIRPLFLIDNSVNLWKKVTRGGIWHLWLLAVVKIQKKWSYLLQIIFCKFCNKPFLHFPILRQIILSFLKIFATNYSFIYQYHQFLKFSTIIILCYN